MPLFSMLIDSTLLRAPSDTSALYVCSHIPRLWIQCSMEDLITPTAHTHRICWPIVKYLLHCQEVICCSVKKGVATQNRSCKVMSLLIYITNTPLSSWSDLKELY